MSSIEVLTRRIAREKKARLAAELILEEKSREVFHANMELTRVAGDLREQMEKMQAILDHAAQGIVTLGSELRIETFNPAAEKIFQLCRSEAINQEFSSLFVDFPLDVMTQAANEEDTGTFELLGCKKDGTEFIVELTMSRINENDSDLYIALLRDRTRRKQLETQLAHAQKMESVGQLAAGIAHEINTPIQFIGDNVRFLSDAFCEIDKLLGIYRQLEEGSRDPADRSTLVNHIREQEQEADLEFIRDEIPEALQQSITGIERVATIVQAMKEFSHPGVVDSTSVDINLALDSTITVSRNEWKYLAEITTDFEQDLPSIQGYPGDLNQAFLNIIVNAAHAIEQVQQTNKENGHPDKGLGSISITTSSTPSEVIIRISDTGCGIPDSKLQKIFEPFYTTKRVGKGTGQGLTVVHSVIVEKHGGKLDVVSETDQGTTFTISLPR